MGVKFEFWFTQTSHSVAFVCNLLLVKVISTFWKGDPASMSKATVFTCLVRTNHLGCFGAWFGAHVWVTFFAGNLYIENMTFSSFYFSPSPLLILSLPNGSLSPGIAMYQFLLRHTFGYIQSKLFLKYFMLEIILSTVSLITFIIDNPVNSWAFEQKLQVSNVLM